MEWAIVIVIIVSVVIYVSKAWYREQHLKKLQNIEIELKEIKNALKEMADSNKNAPE